MQEMMYRYETGNNTIACSESRHESTLENLASIISIGLR